MLVLDPNITNSWNRQITTRFFLISCIKSAKDSLTFKRTVARTFTDFNDLFSIVFLIPAPECDSALTFLCVWAVRRSSRSREKGTRGCWEPPVDPLNQRGDDKQQQHRHHQHHFSASTWPLQLLTRHSLSANRPDVFLFLSPFLHKLLGSFSVLFFFFFWRSCRWSLFPAWLHQNKTCWVSCVAPTRPHRERGRGCGGNHGDPG